MKLSLEKKITTGFAVALLVMVFTGVAAAWNTKRLNEAFRWVEHTHRALSLLEQTLAEVLSLHADVRAFILTEDTTFLSRATEGRTLIDRSIAELRTQMANNPVQLQRLDELDQLLQGAVANTRTVIEVRRTSGLAAVARADMLSEGARAVDAIRSVIGAMETEETQLLEERSAFSRGTMRRMTVAILAVTGLAVMLLAVAIMVVQRDFRLLDLAAARLRQTSDRIEDLYNNAPCGYHSLNRDGVFVAINDTELKWLGYTRAEVVDRMKLPDILMPESLATFDASFPVFKREGAVEGLEFDLRRKDGTSLPVLLNASAIYDAAGNYVASRSTTFDLTARREADRRIQELNTSLRLQNERLAAVNRELEAFSYSVSHDLRAPLRHIDGFAGLLVRQASGLDDTGRRHLDIISNAARKMGRLIDDLLAFSRMSRARLEHELVDSAALVTEALKSANLGLAAERDRVECVVSDLPAVQADRAMLGQVWFNLIDNAIKYSGRSERPRLEIGGYDDGLGERVFFVRDNGVGFDMKYADKLFGVFQRLHAASEFDGTGIGLANVRRIVTRHGGRTWAEGRVGEGACFYFSLPVDPVTQSAPAA